MKELLLLLLLIALIVLSVTVYKFTKLGIIDDAIKCFREDFLDKKQ